MASGCLCGHCTLFIFPCSDVTMNAPDEQSIMTYVSQFLAHFPGIEEVRVGLYGLGPPGAFCVGSDGHVTL